MSLIVSGLTIDYLKGKVRIAFGLQKNQDSIPMSFLELDLLTVLFLDSALEVAVSNKATEEFLKVLHHRILFNRELPLTF